MKNRSPRSKRARSSPSRDAGIAELRRECARLREREERYRNFVEFSSEGIWCFEFVPPIATDQDEDAIIQQSLERGVMVECNDALARMYGYERAEDLLGTPLAEFMSPRKAENVEYIRAFVRSRFRLENGESHEIDREGDPKHFLNNLIGIIEDGCLRQAWGTQRDVTERKLLEEQLRQAQKMEAVGQLAGGLAHDFNNMLTVIGGNLELVLESLGAEGPLARELEEASRAVEQAAGLTHQLLTFSRRHVVQPQAVQINEVLAGVTRMLRRMIPENIEFETMPAPELPPVLGDRVQLDQVLVNLILNARDAMPEGGRLFIETRCLEETHEVLGPAPLGFERGVLIRVTDTGCGIAPRLLERIFEPFFTTKQPGSGSGLGLAMVYAVVTKSGGSVWVESDPDQGASFFVALPAATAVEAEETKALESGDTPTPSATVLLVEDQPEVRHLARQLLEKAGHRVLEAGDAGAALRLAAEHQGPIDLLLSDVVMPGRSGIELARDLRRQRPETRVLFMTGYADLPEEIAGELLRQSRYLSKPFTREGLQREVREALKGHTSEVVSSRKPSRVP